MTRIYGFGDQLAISQGLRQRTDMDTIKALIPGCVSVQKTDPVRDRTGTDYVASLRGGREVNIDAKTRVSGCAKFWKGEPELALEKWSVRPAGKFNTPREAARTGWTLSESNTAELILFTFAPRDTDAVYLYPFQLLRIAFRKNIALWERNYPRAVQESEDGPARRWESECVFVPASVVWSAIEDASRGLQGSNVLDVIPHPPAPPPLKLVCAVCGGKGCLMCYQQ